VASPEIVVSLRGLLVLLVLLAAVVAALYWVGRGAAPPATAPSDAPLVKAFTEAAVQGIDLACAGAEVSLRKDASARWKIARPLEAEADPRRVHDAVVALQEARVRKVIADKSADPAAFGLSPAACAVRLEFAAGTPALSLRLGRSSPVGTERYAAGEDARVVLTDASLFGIVSRGADGFREKRLVPLDPEAITRIALDRPDGRLVVASSGGVWRVESPLRDLAASGACTALARAVASIEVQGAGPVRPPVEAHTERRIRLEVSAPGEVSPIVAFVAAAGIGGKRLGWREGPPLAGLVEESAVKELDRPAESFRDPRIAPFFSPDARRLTIERGATQLRLTRSKAPSSWTGSEGAAAFPVDGARVEALLDRLSGLSAVGFESALPATHATGTIAVDGEHGELARWSFGPLTPSQVSDVESLWITTPARPGVVFRIHAASFGPIPSKAADLAPAASASPEGVKGT
jgi:uncharacterized protein DUF4340